MLCLPISDIRDEISLIGCMGAMGASKPGGTKLGEGVRS